MNTYDVRRLALLLSVQAEIEGMKAWNQQSIVSSVRPYGREDFEEKAKQLRKVATMPDHEVAPTALNGFDL